MKKLPIGKQVFKTVIEDGFIYVDKTKFLVELAESGIATFLSRPRRFGKSMTVNTFKELFKGSRELFKDTYAYNNWNWEKKSPVIKLDMSVVTSINRDEFYRSLMAVILSSARENGIKTLHEDKIPHIAFRELIENLALRENPVVVLIDEYDAPILDALGKDSLPEIKELLRSFYKVLKEQEEKIRFVFITGISKFSKVGVFSTLNNLKDITLNPRYGAITGYTKEEIEFYFAENIENSCQILSVGKEEFWRELKHYYNGYSWDGKQFVYNPFSILLFFDDNTFLPYWMDSGSPSFMSHYAEEIHLNLDDLEGKSVDRDFLSYKDIDETSPESFLTQAGYLTIKECDEDGDYILDFPNYEVRHAFNSLILKSQYKVASNDLLLIKKNIKKALLADNTEALIKQFKAIYSSIPSVYYSGNKNEYFFTSMLLMFLTAAGYDVFPEKYGNGGRMDLVFYWKQKRVYIIELKMDSAGKALKQIKEKDYCGQFTNFKTILIGLKIDSRKKNIVDWLIEK